MKTKIFNRLIVTILCTALLMGNVISVSAIGVVNGEENNIETVTSKVTFKEDMIIEYEEVMVNQELITIEKRTYANNTATLEVKENGEVYKYDLEANYAVLKANLDINNIANMVTTRGGLQERYLTTFKSVDHLTPKNITYAGVLEAFSALLSKLGIPGATIAKIASAWYAINSSSTETWITSERKFYEVYDSTGYFLGYYKVYFNIKTEVKIDGKRKK